MGLDRKIVLQAPPAWQTWTGRLAQQGLTATLRMVDGELAFPDEVPAESWRELRISLPAGMVTLRREDDGVRLVVWGNASEQLLREVEMLAAALAQT